MIRPLLETWLSATAGVLLYSLIFDRASLSDTATWGRSVSIGLITALLLLAYNKLKSRSKP
jgi:hypothetical protein